MDNQKNNKKLRQRFSKDFNLPINIFDEKYFNYYSRLYDFFPTEMWEYVNKRIDEDFGGNVENWLNYCADFRDRAIIETMATDEYKAFNSMDMSQWEVNPDVPKIGEHSVYTEENDGRYFISIDLKKANFQALKKAGVLKDETYEDFVERFGGDEYIKNSKYLRQVIFGKMNPGRTIKVEKYIMGEIYLAVHLTIEGMGYEFFSLNSDELVFRGKKDVWKTLDKDLCEKFENAIRNMLGVDARVEHYRIDDLNIENYNGNKVDAYVKTVNGGGATLKKTSTTFYPQIYKMWKGKPIWDEDLVFFFEDQLAKFEHELVFRDGVEWT